MLPPELIKYIQQSLNQGHSREKIKALLLQSGWSPELVEQALESASPPASQDASTTQTFALNLQDAQNPPDKKEDRPNKIYQYFYGLLGGLRRFRVFLVCLGLAVVASVYPVYKIFTVALPFVRNLDRRVLVIVDEIFPEELEIVIKNGRASTNVTEPYFLTISQSALQNFLQIDEGENRPQAKLRLLTINTSGKAEDFERYQSAAMLTSTSLVHYSDEDVQIQSLSNFPDMVISKENIIRGINEWSENIKVTGLLQTILYFSPIFIVFFLWLRHLGEIFGGTIIVWIMNKIHLTQIPFGRLFSFTGSLYVLPALLLILIKLTPGVNLFYGWFATGLNILWLTIAYLFIKKYKEKHQAV